MQEGNRLIETFSVLSLQAAKGVILQSLEINMNTITVCFCYKISLSVVAFGKDSLAPFSRSEHSLSQVFSQRL